LLLSFFQSDQLHWCIWKLWLCFDQQISLARRKPWPNWSHRMLLFWIFIFIEAWIMRNQFVMWRLAKWKAWSHSAIAKLSFSFGILFTFVLCTAQSILCIFKCISKWIVIWLRVALAILLLSLLLLLVLLSLAGTNCDAYLLLKRLRHWDRAKNSAIPHTSCKLMCGTKNKNQMQTHAAPKFRETIRNQTTKPANKPTVDVRVVGVGERWFLLLLSKAHVHDFPPAKTSMSISNADFDFQMA